MTEKEYRKENRLSYSSVKMFDSDRIKFYKKVELRDNSVEEEMSTAMKLGSLVDCKLFSAAEFDDKFVIASCLAPTGQMGDFTEKLCNITLQNLDEDLKVTKPITELMEDAFKAVKYNTKGEEVAFKKKDFQWLVTNFVGSEAETYYKVCRSQFGKTVVDLNLMTAAEKTIDELRECKWTKDVVNAETIKLFGEQGEVIKDIEVFDQLAILYDVDGEPFKGMPDRIIVDHLAKTITPYDLKVSYSGEDFQYNYWKMKYYLQVASYYLALMHWKKTAGFEDYVISSIKFIVASSTLQSNPLLYSTDIVNINEGLYGFVTKNGVKYKGLYELVKEIQWHRENQLWRNSKEVYDLQGEMTIRPFEEKQIN